MSNFEDLTGRTFCRLTVCEPAVCSNTHRMRRWSCRCECGASVIATSSYLKFGRQTSCGKCDRFKDLTGRKFARLTVVGLSRREAENGNHYKSTFWKCICECGNEKEVRSNALTGGGVKSCGCLHRDSMRTKVKTYKGIHLSWWDATVKRAASRGFEFAISIEYAWGLFEFQDGRCGLSGRELSFGDNSVRLMKEFGKSQTASLDRIDSLLGYVEGNVWWVHKDFNLFKLNYGIVDFVSMCNEVAKHDGKHSIMDRLSSWPCKSGVTA